MNIKQNKEKFTPRVITKKSQKKKTDKERSTENYAKKTTLWEQNGKQKTVEWYVQWAEKM